MEKSADINWSEQEERELPQNMTKKTEKQKAGEEVNEMKGERTYY